MTIKVSVNELDEKIWRIIEIDEDKVLNDLAATILATFNSLATHSYEFYKYNWSYRILLNSERTKIRDIKDVIMSYDNGSITFNISCISELKKANYHFEEHFIIAGMGAGILEDVNINELMKIVNKTDRLGYSDFNYSDKYNTNKKFDYKDYDIGEDNRTLRERINYIKESYKVSS